MLPLPGIDANEVRVDTNGAPKKSKIFWGDQAFVFLRSLPYQSSEYQ